MIEYFILLIVFLIILDSIYYLTNIFQQNHYDSKKLLRNVRKYYLKNHQLYYLIVVLINSFLNEMVIQIIVLVLGIVTLLVRRKYIIKLKFTARVIRLIVTLMLFIGGVVGIFLQYYIYILILIVVLLPHLIIVVNYILRPVERTIANSFVKKARIKLANNKQLIKIGITGSFGKTSTKMILKHLLEDDYMTLASPKSYNTLMGLTRTINEYLMPHHQIFICEMGAFREGEINELATFINPDIGVITEIGPQHLVTFKNIETIVKTKFELIDHLSYDKVAVLNGDNSHILTRHILNVNHITYVGLDKANEYRAENIIVDGGQTTFDIYHQEQFIVHIVTKLLGTHNINNILIAYGVIQGLKKFNINLSDEKFQTKIMLMEPVEHRLSYRRLDHIHIYDDSYNSNIKGIVSAINTIKLVKTKKVIITPGLVDGGVAEEELNSQLAYAMLDVFDLIYLIDNPSSRHIAKVLDQHEVKYEMKKSFQDAFQAFTNAFEEEVSLLIANDLPDNYLER